jgi:hypothetical protein
MGFSDWVSETAENTQNHGVYGLKNAYHEFMKGALMRIGRFWNYGDDIFTEEWDALIVLDACRADLLESVAKEYAFLENADEHHISNASSSAEWMTKNLVSQPERTQDICYVSANPHDQLLSDANFTCIERVWENLWDESINVTPPKAVTDTAIATHRRNLDSRLIVHYMQPHAPYVSTGRREPFMDVKLGKISHTQLWAEYQENLRYVLDDVERLLRNVSAEKVVITADHGEALGEFGVYGHRNDVPIDGLKEVPWCATTATDTGRSQPDMDRYQHSDAQSIEEKLEHLGYR